MSAKRPGGGLDKAEARIREWTAGTIEIDGKRATAINGSARH
ncbi:MAG: hypothetical protein ACLP0J_26115 [Solirubrobacteraceae bacterium]|jgi:hypothetical protein